MSYLYDAMKEEYAKITLLGKQVLFSCARNEARKILEYDIKFQFQYSNIIEGISICNSVSAYY